MVILKAKFSSVILVAEYMAQKKSLVFHSPHNKLICFCQTVISVAEYLAQKKSLLFHSL